VSCPSLCVPSALCCRVAAWWLFSLLFRCWFGQEFTLFEFWLEFPGQSSHNIEMRSDYALCLDSSPLRWFMFLMYLGCKGVRGFDHKCGLTVIMLAQLETGTRFRFLSIMTTIQEGGVLFLFRRCRNLSLRYIHWYSWGLNPE
jgi:hypothetical protein